MAKIPVGQHHFVRSFLPALIAVLLASSLALLGLGVLRERRLESLARAMAQRVAPGSQVALQLDLAVGQLPVAAAATAQTGDDRDISDAEDRLTSAALAYDGWARAAHVDGYTLMAPAAARFGESVAAANPHGAHLDALTVERAFDDLSEQLRANRNQAAAGVTGMLGEFAGSQARHRWEELALLTCLVGGCIALLVTARRREERVCADEVETVQSLVDTNADLEAFAGRVAHDLRNPLVPILSGSEMIERCDVDARVRRAAERIERSARRLASMIDMLLDFSRLGSSDRRPSWCEVPPIVEEVVDGFADKARAHDVTLVVSCAPTRAACEPIVISSPLQNLIENAFKYGRCAGAAQVIEVRAFPRAGMVLIEVEDRGPGIDARDAESLFRPFQRGGQRGEGVGLGLATARRLVEARGGSIGLRVGRFGGALFQIRLPEVPGAGGDRRGDDGVTALDVPA